MRPATAFAIGLWVGGLAVGAVSFLYGRLAPANERESETAMMVRQAEQLRWLEQENARLGAEAQRLSETVAELKSAQPQMPRRRIPLRGESAGEETDGAAVTAARQWAAAVESDAEAVRRLRELFADAAAPVAVVVAAVEALSRPAAEAAVDVEGRLGLLAELAERTTNAAVQAAIEAGEGELARRWMAEPVE